MNIKLDDYYVVTALEGNERVYVGIDSNSGGYPYWSGHAQRKHKQMIDAIKEMKSDVYGTGISYMQRNVRDIGVAKVSTTLTMIDLESNEVVEQIRQTALEKLSDEEKAVLGLK